MVDLVGWVLSLFGLDAESHAHIYLFGFGVVTLVVVAVWADGLRHGHNSLMDAFYGFLYPAVAWLAFLASGANSLYAGLLILMVSLHGCRLGYHLTKRWLGLRKTTGGDARLMAIAEHFGRSFWWKGLLITMLPQSAVVMVVGLPAYFGIMAAADGSPGLNVLGTAGMAVFGVGSYYEWLGDGQLQAFKQDPANEGRYLEHGVWRLTRHPNYFGNVCVWWGIYLAALAADPGLWWTVAGPLLNVAVLTRGTGARFMDRFLGGRPEYRALMARRSAFVPWPAKRPSG